MAKFKLIICALSLLLVANSALAFEANSIIKKDIPFDYLFRGTFDNLVLDFIIATPQSDKINAISLQNAGTATDANQIDKLILWIDDGPIGFQGIGVDKKIGEMTYFSTIQNWYLDHLNLEINGSLRFFVSVEISPYVSKAGDIQLLIPRLADNNQNGSYDLFDLGIFMESKNNGPTDKTVMNANAQNISLSTVDNLEPKINITNLQNNQIIDFNNFIIKGIIRDQGNTSIKDKNIYIDSQKFPILDYDDLNFEWEFNWQNIRDGSHTIKVTASDQAGNQGESNEITIIKVSPTISNQPEEPQQSEEPAKASYSAGDLIKASGPAVYYYGQDGKRYVFPNLNTYKTWYADFLGVKTITDLDLGSIPIGGNVTYKPGVKLVKITTDPKVYAVAANGTLRWITTEALAIALYGANWGSLVEDLPDPFFVNYTVGAPITSTADYLPEAVRNAAVSIGVDKGLL